MLAESRIGEQCAALVTGASAKGTWARLLIISVEGRGMFSAPLALTPPRMLRILGDRM